MTLDQRLQEARKWPRQDWSPRGLCLCWEEQCWTAGCGGPGPRPGKGCRCQWITQEGRGGLVPLGAGVVKSSRALRAFWRECQHDLQQTGNGVWNNTTTQGSVAQASTECRHHTGAGERWGVMRQAKRRMPSHWWSHHWAPTAHCPPSKTSQS